VDLPGQRHHPDQLRRLLLVQARPADGHGLLRGDPGGRAGDLLGLEGAGVGQELDDLPADPVEAGAQLDQHLGGHALALADQPEQDVLGADVVVVEEPGLLLGEHDHPPGPVGETLEHRHRPSRAQPP